MGPCACAGGSAVGVDVGCQEVAVSREGYMPGCGQDGGVGGISLVVVSSCDVGWFGGQEVGYVEASHGQCFLFFLCFVLCFVSVFLLVSSLLPLLILSSSNVAGIYESLTVSVLIPSLCLWS